MSLRSKLTLNMGHVDVIRKQMFVGSLEGNTHANMFREINILAHATDVPISTEQLTRVKNLRKKYRARDHMESSPNTTDWNKTNEVKGKPSSHNIEPWTFGQHLGEAFFIPAGYPYQIRKLKSCINVVLEFISPENIVECIKLTDEVRLLPLHNKAKDKILEVISTEHKL
ncbi:hypothetical protein RJ639_020216 [Escallonia herrerae]|uniref:JmjC domain-containing protein n=1 Tax=Escallonia herrerae TaxID=1293975 RepID=A0AA88VA99_9ASTE|nr:hypothetical protein RJ639_020216 [Escallonia herrerae]